MQIEIITGENRDDLGWEQMKIDGKNRLSVYPLNECPEDATIERGLISCVEIAELMKAAYEAGKCGEELSIVVTQSGV